jgi:ribose transport system substrate-binding protein
MKKSLITLLAAIFVICFSIPVLAQDEGLPKGDWVIGLSNSYYGNGWRKQMVESFTEAADNAKNAGYIKDYIIQNGDGTVNAQIAQINSFILKGVNAIAINAASPTALNSVIQKALDAGIVVVAFVSIIEGLDDVYTMDYDFYSMGEKKTEYVMERLGGKGNVVVVRGVSGTSPDIGVYNGIMSVLNKYPDVKKVTEIYGEASATVAQENMLKVLPSLPPDIDAVITFCGNDSIGVVNAFEQSGREVPIVIGDNTAEFMNWWIAKKKDSNYETLSVNSTPSCGSAAVWAVLNILNKVDVPKKMLMSLIYVTQDEAEKYSDLKPGTIASPYFSNQDVLNNIIIPARQAK